MKLICVPSGDQAGFATLLVSSATRAVEGPPEGSTRRSSWVPLWFSMKTTAFPSGDHAASVWSASAGAKGRGSPPRRGRTQ